MSILKKLMCITMSTVLCLSLSIPAFASEAQKEFLEERGFPTDFLERRTDNQIDKLYKACLEENLKFDSTKVVSLEEKLKDGEQEPYGSIPSEDMSLEITPLVKVFSDQEVELVRVFVFYEWAKTKPFIQKDDAISVNWDSDLFAYDRNFELSCCSDDMEYSSKTRPDEASQGGIGVFAELANTAGILSGTCSFDLVPKTTPMYLAEKSDSGRIAHNINVEYVHDKSLVSGGLSFVVKGVSVSINVSGSSDKASASSTEYYKF